MAATTAEQRKASQAPPSAPAVAEDAAIKADPAVTPGLDAAAAEPTLAQEGADHTPATGSTSDVSVRASDAPAETSDTPVQASDTPVAAKAADPRSLPTLRQQLVRLGKRRARGPDREAQAEEQRLADLERLQSLRDEVRGAGQRVVHPGGGQGRKHCRCPGQAAGLAARDSQAHRAGSRRRTGQRTPRAGSRAGRRRRVRAAMAGGPGGTGRPRRPARPDLGGSQSLGGAACGRDAGGGAAGVLGSA